MARYAGVACPAASSADWLDRSRATVQVHHERRSGRQTALEHRAAGAARLTSDRGRGGGDRGRGGGGAVWLAAVVSAQQFLKLGEVHRHPPRLVAGGQACDLRDAVRNCRGEEKLRKSEGEAPFQL
jgi:hypothetical protein